MSLVELLVAMSILSVILVLLFGVLQESQRAWGNARDQLKQFQEARLAFETMTRRITDSVLQPYWGYEYPDGDTSKVPSQFSRQSELHFVSGPAATGSEGEPLLSTAVVPSHAVFFHGPFGHTEEENWEIYSTLINGWGYYIDHFDPSNDRPDFLSRPEDPTNRRFRLMELRIPADELETYQVELEESTARNWFRKAISDGHTRMVAENVIALVVSPEAPEGTLSDPSAIAPNYFYDTRAFLSGRENYAVRRSKHQLPPLLRITMVVLDQTSAIRLQEKAGSSQPDVGLSELFVDARRYEQDLNSLESTLLEEGIRHRTFSTVVRLRNSKWSETEPE